MVRVSSSLTSLVVLAACTDLAPGMDYRDADVDAGRDASVDAAIIDASHDANDAADAAPCEVPPDAECPPLCAREPRFVGNPFGAVRIVASDQTLSCEYVYRFMDSVIIEDGATLTIEPGVQLEAGPSAYFLVESGARLVAEGSAELPIVFTSNAGDDGSWPGVLLFGDAPTAEGETVDSELFYHGRVGRSAHGGTDGAHDCGSLEFVRIENAGHMATPDTDFVALTAAGCGSETSFDHVQIWSSAHRGVYLIGGGFPIRHLIVSEQRAHDALKWNLGWAGSVQWFIAKMAGEHGENAIEGRMWNPLPVVSPIVANATLVNPYVEEEDGNPALRMTAGSGIRAYNFIIQGYSRIASIQGTTMALERFDDPGYFTLAHMIIGEDTPFANDEIDPRMAPPMNENRRADLMLTAGLRPSIDGPANEGAAEDLEAIGLETTAYVGAIDPAGDDWTEGWTR